MNRSFAAYASQFLNKRGSEVYSEHEPIFFSFSTENNDEELELEEEGLGSGLELRGESREGEGEDLQRSLLRPKPEKQSKDRIWAFLWVISFAICYIHAFILLLTTPSSSPSFTSSLLTLFVLIFFAALASYAQLFILFILNARIRLPLFLTQLNRQQLLLSVIHTVLLHNPILLALNPAVLVVGLIAASVVPFGWVIWTVWRTSSLSVLFTLGVWIWTWGVLKGLVRVLTTAIVGTWYFGGTVQLDLDSSLLGTICLSSIILTSTRLLTFILLTIPTFLSSFVLPSLFIRVLSFPPLSLLRSFSGRTTYALVYAALTRSTFWNAAKNVGKYETPRTMIPVSFLSLPTLTLPVPFAILTYLITLYPSVSLIAALTTVIVSIFSVGLLSDVADAVWVCWCLQTEAEQRASDENQNQNQIGNRNEDAERKERKRRVAEVFESESDQPSSSRPHPSTSSPPATHPAHPPRPHPLSTPYPESPDSPNSLDSPESIHVFLHPPTDTRKPGGLPRGVTASGSNGGSRGDKGKGDTRPGTIAAADHDKDDVDPFDLGHGDEPEGYYLPGSGLFE
ncbi:hypothetical protein EV361DRAFT_909499 [Lentinula raphanica]|nr:hypothetical protein EV361DRAFT_909499 [Lentinula raphanica]